MVPVRPGGSSAARSFGADMPCSAPGAVLAGPASRLAGHRPWDEGGASLVATSRSRSHSGWSGRTALSPGGERVLAGPEPRQGKPLGGDGARAREPRRPRRAAAERTDRPGVRRVTLSRKRGLLAIFRASRHRCPGCGQRESRVRGAEERATTKRDRRCPGALPLSSASDCATVPRGRGRAGPTPALSASASRPFGHCCPARA